MLSSVRRLLSLAILCASFIGGLWFGTPAAAQQFSEFLEPTSGGDEWVIFAGEHNAPLVLRELDLAEVYSVRKRFERELPNLEQTLLVESENVAQLRSAVESGALDSLTYRLLLGELLDDGVGSGAFLVVALFDAQDFRGAQILYDSSTAEDAHHTMNFILAAARGDLPPRYDLTFRPECPCEDQCQIRLVGEMALCEDFANNCVIAAEQTVVICLGICILTGANPFCLTGCLALNAIQLIKCDKDHRTCNRGALGRHKDCLTDCDQ